MDVEHNIHTCECTSKVTKHFFFQFSFFTGNTKITVLSDDDCGGSYVINSGSLQIKYHGTRLYDCSFTILTQDAEKKLCADFETLDIRSCATTIKLYGYNGENDERIAFKVSLIFSLLLSIYYLIVFLQKNQKIWRLSSFNGEE